LRPLQYEAMRAACEGRSSLVVLPTGGGKSLCYQAPALLADEPTVVVSPLIALMKDQVDGLLARNVPAAFLNSSLDAADRRRVAEGVANRAYRLIFVAPERFASERSWELLATGGIGSFAIDEAHCISHWGHDFRSDYRKLNQLKHRFPGASVHAFTATATPRVRQDIIAQLALADPVVLVGDFFRPNLVYSVRRRGHAFDDVCDAVAERSGMAGIVYCIRRRDVDELTADLTACGIKAVGYHAGMSDEQRTRAQDAFAAGAVDVVVATVAFGMGIDRADIRFVIHAAMPKSIEHYQQETGRAGRDGKKAECILFFSGGDFGKWKGIIEQNESTHREVFTDLLSEMYRFCTGVSCRHRKLVTYFGQQWTRNSCGACDVCNDGPEPLGDSTVIAQKIMSAVHRTGERFGAAYVCEVLLGHESERILGRGHEQLSTFGLLRDHDKPTLTAWIDQLEDGGLVEREREYRVVRITAQGWQVLRSQAEARLFPVQVRQERKRTRRATSALGPELSCPACGYSLIGSTSGVCPECGQALAFEQLGISKARFLKRARELAGSEPDGGQHETSVEDNSAHASVGARRALPDSPLEGTDQALFEKLRTLRREIADEMNAPAFVVFSDKTLRALARAKPVNEDALLAVKGIGPVKCESFGPQFLEVIREYGA